MKTLEASDFSVTRVSVGRKTWQYKQRLVVLTVSIIVPLVYFLPPFRVVVYYQVCPLVYVRVFWISTPFVDKEFHYASQHFKVRRQYPRPRHFFMVWTLLILLLVCIFLKQFRKKRREKKVTVSKEKEKGKESYIL